MKISLESPPVRAGLIVVVAFLASCFAIFALNLFAAPRPLAELVPTRTVTRRPPPTITPVAYPPTPQLVLADDFTTNDNFPETQGVKLGFDYQGSAYVLTPPQEPGFVRVLNQTFTESDYRNLSLVADAGPANAALPIEYGLLFWHSEDEQGREHFMAFTLNSKNTFRLLAYEPLEDAAAEADTFQFTEVIPATETQAIHRDGKPNNIRLDVHPRRLLAYINDELVLDTDSKIVSEWRLRPDWDGRVGMVAFEMGVRDAQARFTRYDVYADVKQP